MFKFKATLIALAITFLMLAGFVNSSHAIEIVEFPSDTKDDSYNGYTYHMAYVRTDNPIYHVSWYIDNKWVYGETLDSTTSYASYYPYNKIPGIILGGKEYKIGVKVWEWDAEDEEFRFTTDSYKVTVFEPDYTFNVDGKVDPDIPEVSGYSEISRYYRSGDDVILDFYASLSYHGNDKEKSYNVFTEIKNTIDGLDNPSDQGIIGILGKDKKNDSFNASFSQSGTVSASLSRGAKGTKYACDAYVRIVVRDGNRDDYFRGRRVWHTK